MRESANASLQNTSKQLVTTKDSVRAALENLNSLSQINGMASAILDIANKVSQLLDIVLDRFHRGAVIIGFLGEISETFQYLSFHVL